MNYPPDEVEKKWRKANKIVKKCKRKLDGFLRMTFSEAVSTFGDVKANLDKALDVIGEAAIIAEDFYKEGQNGRGLGKVARMDQ